MGLSVKQTIFVPLVPLKYFFLISNFSKYLPVTLQPANSFINPARSFYFFRGLPSFPSAVVLATSPNPLRVPLYPHFSPHTCVFVHVALRCLWLFFRQQPRRLDCHNLWSWVISVSNLNLRMGPFFLSSASLPSSLPLSSPIISQSSSHCASPCDAIPHRLLRFITMGVWEMWWGVGLISWVAHQSLTILCKEPATLNKCRHLPSYIIIFEIPSDIRGLELLRLLLIQRRAVAWLN